MSGHPVALTDPFGCKKGLKPDRNPTGTRCPPAALPAPQHSQPRPALPREESMGHVELSWPGLLRGTNPRLWRAEVKPPGAELTPAPLLEHSPGLAVSTSFGCSCSSSGRREELWDMNKSKAQHRSTRKPPELSPGSSLAHEVPLINLIKYFIRAVMGN